MTVAHQSTSVCVVIVGLHKVASVRTSAWTTRIVSDDFEVSRDTTSDRVNHTRSS
jgi:hypothetical protein